MAYTTLPDVKLYLGIETSNTNDDALLTELIAQSQQMIDSFTHRTFEAEADTIHYFSYGDISGLTLFLDADLCQITKITNGDATLVPDTAYMTEPRNRTPWYAIYLRPGGSVLWSATDDIQIEGRWAYSVAAPQDIARATIRLTAFLYRQKDNSMDLDRPVASQDGVILMPSSLPSDITKTLAPYVARI